MLHSDLQDLVKRVVHILIKYGRLNKTQTNNFVYFPISVPTVAGIGCVEYQFVDVSIEIG